MDKFFDALDNFIAFVRKHYGVFFWLCWLYLFALLTLQMVFELSEMIAGIAIIPMNLITWPVFLEARKFKGLSLLERRMVWMLPTVSTLLPLFLLFDLLG